MKWSKNPSNGDWDRNAVPWSALAARDQFEAETRIPPRVPTDQYQSVMEAPPNTEPAMSLDDRHELREIINDAVEGLDPEDKWIWEARVHRKMSIRAIGRELGIPKTSLGRQLQAIREQLQQELQTHPVIKEHFGEPMETWQEGIAAAGYKILGRYQGWFAHPTTCPPATCSETLDVVESRLQELRDDVRNGTPVAIVPADYEIIGAAAHGSSGWTMRETEAFVTNKQRDYGSGNILAFGHTGLVVRISDKVARIRNLEARGSEGVVEPLVDAWVDLVGYSLVGLMLLDGTFTLPLAEDLEARRSADGNQLSILDTVF